MPNNQIGDLEMKKGKKDTEILFAYPKAVNKSYLKKISNTTGQPLGYILDRMVESFRLKKNFEVEPKITGKEKDALKARKKKKFEASNERPGVSK